ncbi:MAG TPA: hypothetical protein VMW80_10900, partial [Candidatus Dormibacteraeota bacterium]|nr:hypothetical protein [Candidatus Dormibacteraeota bacterium]
PVDVLGGEVPHLVGGDCEREVLTSPYGVEEALGAALDTIRGLAGDELTVLVGNAISEGLITAARDIRQDNWGWVWDRVRRLSAAWSKRPSPPPSPAH